MTLTATSVETGRYIGSRMLRKEDAPLIAGQGRYVDNLVLPGMLFMAVVRSPMAHARITGVDVSAALQVPGVLAAYSGADLASDWAAGLPCAWPVAPETRIPTHWPVAQDKARMVGGPVDMVVAEAPVTVKQRHYHPRLIPNAIEPRGVLVQPIPVTGEMTMWSSTQIPHILRTLLALTLNIPESKFRVIAPDVGGAFGSKLDVYGEEAICLAVARRLGVPVKWIEERSEGYLATIHGRDVIQEVEVAATEEGRLLGVRAKVLCDMGAYCQLVAPGIQVLGATLFIVV